MNKWYFYKQNRYERTGHSYHLSMGVFHSPKQTVPPRFSEVGSVWLIIKTSCRHKPPQRTGASSGWVNIHLTLTNIKKSCSMHHVILSWENQQATTAMGLVPLGQWDTAYLHQSGKDKEEMAYGHQTYNFSIGLWMPWQKSLFLSVREDGTWKEAAGKTREVRKNGNCCITELWHGNECLQCELLSVHMQSHIPRGACFSNMG